MHKKGEHGHHENLDNVPAGFKNHKSVVEQVYEENDLNKNTINENELKLINHELTREEEIKYRIERWQNFRTKLDNLNFAKETHLAREVRKFKDQEEVRLNELGVDVSNLLE